MRNRTVIGFISMALLGIVAAAGYLFYGWYDCMNRDVDSSGFIDKQLEVRIDSYEERIERDFVVTESGKGYELSVQFKYPDSYGTEKAIELNLFKKLKALVSELEFSISDKNGEEVEFVQIKNPSALSNPDNITFLLAANVNLKKNQRYFIKLRIPSRFQEVIFLKPVIYINRKPCPTL